MRIVATPSLSLGVTAFGARYERYPVRDRIVSQKSLDQKAKPKPKRICSVLRYMTMASSSNTNSDELVVFKVDDFQTLARERLSKALYEYLSSGTDDEQTLRENRSAFSQWYLRPRVMRPVGSLSCRTSLLGQPLAMPVFVSPAGVHALCDELSGECATARACQAAGILFGLSQHATRSIEDVALAAPGVNRWYQAYILKDRTRTLQLVRRAVQAGYQGIFLTVDSVRFGFREADARNG
jgi:(S)-2-hydroxy-acid oxidase